MQQKRCKETVPRSVQSTNLLILGDELAVWALFVDGLDVGRHGRRGPADVGAQRAAHVHALRVLVQLHHVCRGEGTQLAELSDRGLTMDQSLQEINNQQIPTFLLH